jgi:uncharacterized protein YcbK (DUF882 family)
MSLGGAAIRLGLAGFLLIGAVDSLQNAIAEGDTRTLSFHHVHTGEDITITYKVNGRYDQAALKKLDWFMRDWRKEQSTHMDPQLFDLLWEVYREVGATRPIEIICGYRSPGTNAMLRARSNGVARNSQHTHGHAIDFFIPDVPLSKIRAVGLKLQRGGVGFYPTSGSPFVHLDTGTIRHWPHIARNQLRKIFPDGRTVHIPSDGKPMRNFALALADVERRGKTPNAVSLEKARQAGVISERDMTVALQERHENKPRSLLAALFGGGRDEEADDDTASEQQAPARAPAVVASAKPAAGKPAVPLPLSRPKPVVVASATPVPVPMPLPASSPAPAAAPAADNIFNRRGYWHGAVTTPAPITSPFNVASADWPAVTGSTALAYAADTPIETNRQAKSQPMGRPVPHLASTATASPTERNTTIVGKTVSATMAIGGQRPGSPWLRAAMLTPSVTGYMTTTRLGATDPRWLHDQLHKPTRALVMTFTGDPQYGLVANRFTGSAVVFLATATFTRAQTASLR